MNKRIAHIAVDIPVEGHFDYSLPDEYQEDAQVGMRVLVSFARQKRVGVIVGFSSRSSFPKLNPVLALLDEEPVFTPAFLKFAEAFSLRFGCSLGEALFQFLPKYLRSAKKSVSASPPENQAIAKKGGAVSSSTLLIFDRGQAQRWAFLMPLIQATLDQGRSVICAVPDATHLDHIVPLFRKLGLAPVHLSQGTDKEEYEAWQALRTGQARVAVGYISAVFSPASNLGMIILCEEDSSHYKHDQSPFYHARDAALLRARVEGNRVVLASSAPSLEAWHEAEEGRMTLEVLPDALPPVRFLDLRNFKMKKDTFVSLGLRHHLEWTLKENRRTILYIQAARGVNGVIDEVKKMFPWAKVAGYDKSSGPFPMDAQIVVATQAVLRHRYQVKCDITVVLDIDWEFHKSDYRASHGAFALTQHLRQMTKEFVLLQTRHMENELLHYLADDDVQKFYRKELGLRKEMDLPPFRYLVAMVVRSTDPELAEAEAGRLYGMLLAVKPETVEMHEPQQDRSAIVRGKFRWCVMVQGRSLKTVMGFVKEGQRAFRGKKDTVLTINVNP